MLDINSVFGVADLGGINTGFQTGINLFNSLIEGWLHFLSWIVGGH